MTVLYIHGKGGCAAESARYAPLFPGFTVAGLDYRSDLPWKAGKEIRDAVESLRQAGEGVILIANSIGAFFALHAGIDEQIERAYFISPVTDMEGLILGMMRAAGVTEDELKAKGEIKTPSGETLSWEYLSFVRAHPVRWTAPTEILYGGRDVLTPYETIAAFAQKTGAHLTVMEDGEHWFHTDEQLHFLDQWIIKGETKHANQNP